MPNHKSAEKRVRQTERRTLRNRIVRQSGRTEVKKVRAAIEAGDKAAAEAALKAATKALATASSKGVVHKNNAARRIGRLAAQVGKLG